MLIRHGKEINRFILRLKWLGLASVLSMEMFSEIMNTLEARSLDFMCTLEAVRENF